MDKQAVRSSVMQQKLEILRKLVSVKTDENIPPAQREAAKRSLQRIGNHTIVDALGEAIEENKNDEILTGVVDVLSFLPVTATVRTSLIKLLWHDSPIVRRSAIQSLSQTGDNETASVLAVVSLDSQKLDSIFDETDNQLAQRARETILRRNSNH